ncbi:PAS domain-containing hybrid sensor histidine kinase/response regulator [Noviherbaspirillum pedocola]|uniref:histidine kinase n=1 Tax=Noviherbaspirillum pedocola TaxID=2801341 RepID=A0A934SR01_9BURK|nr:PAS domain-containing protein [Noviherbaspirillum pedocola]MBK4734985.1 PAS domain-containing protein [Noviherbaspirillum pedocola]
MLHDDIGPAPGPARDLPDWFFEGSSDCIEIIDLQGNIARMNGSGLHAMEVESVEQIRNAPWMGFWPVESQPTVRAALHAALGGKTAHCRAFRPTLKGSPKWWDVNIHPVGDESGKTMHLVAVSRDMTDLHNAELALSEEKERIGLATEAAELGLWRYTPHLHLFTFQNGRARAIFGLAAGSMDRTEEQIVREAIVPEDRDRFQRAIQAACEQGERLTFHGRIRRADGEVRWVDMFGHAHRAEDGSAMYLLGTVLDITDRKSTEQALHDAQLRLAATLNAGEVATWTWDIRKNLVYGDRNIAYLFSLPEEEAHETPLESFMGAIHPDDVDRVSSSILKALQDGTFYQETYRVRARDGKFHWIVARGRVEYDAEGLPMQLPGVVLDVTLQKEIEDKLHASEDRYRALFESIDEGFCIFEILRDAQGEPIDYRFKESNSAFRTQAGYEATPGKTILEIFPDLDRRWIRLYADVAKTGQPVRIQDHVDMLNRWFDIHAVRVGGQGSEHVAVLFTDITNRRETEDDLRRLAFSLAETDQRKTEFLATLAHELRNPLAPIRNGLQLIRLAGNNADTVARVRDMMERQVTHMIHLVNDLLDIARISSGKVELKKREVDLKEIVATAIEANLPSIQNKQHELNVDVPEEAFPLEADATRIAQVLGNLLNNAAKYTPDGGQIDLSMRREGNDAILRVTDSGIGIPVEAQGSIFDMFAQVKDNMGFSHGGLGIGLSLVQSLVQLHGGDVSVSSPGSGQGSSFTVRLPLLDSRRDSALDARSPTGKAKADGAGLRVLLIDDNVDAAQTLAELIQIGGHEVSLAHTGRQGIDAVEGFKPDIVFLDIGLPDMDGYAVLRKIRQGPIGRTVPVAALTGWGADGDRRKTADAGFDHHLVKPAPLPLIESLLAEVAQTLRARKS